VGRLVRLARSGRVPQLESEWLEALEAGRPDLQEMLDAADYLAKKGGREQAAVLLWALAGAVPEEMSPHERLDLFRKAVTIVPADRTLREHLSPLLRGVHPDSDSVESILQAIPARLSSQAALDLAERCLTLRNGAYLEDPAGEVLRVERYVPEQQAFEVRPPGGPGKLVVTVAELSGYRTLPPGNLRALFLFEREELQKLCDESPAELIKAVVGGMGGRAGWRQVRARLVGEGLLSARSWGSWWATAKKQMEAAGLFELTTDGDIVLRETALSPPEVLLRALARTDTAASRAQVLMEELARLGSRADEAQEELGSVLEGVSARAHEEWQKDPWGNYLLLTAALRGGRSIGVSASASPPTVLPPVPEDPLVSVSEKLLEEALDLAREVSPSGWPAWWRRLWPKLTLRLCEKTAVELLNHGLGSELIELLSDAATRPDAHPNAFLWLWKTVCAPRRRYDGPLPTVKPLTLTFSLLGLSERMSRPQPGMDDELRKAFLARMRSALRADDYAAVRALVRESPPAALRRLRTGVSSSRVLGTALREALLEIIRSRRIAPDVPPWKREDVVWVTRRSLEKRRQELDNLLRVELPANSRAIGEAAARGDLSENAEWAAALDQQKLLASRATQMQKELSMARVIGGEAVTSGVVGLGTVATVERVGTGERSRLTFLGPWDSDPDHGIYSYLAPFSKAFMGKKTGDVAAPPGSPEQEYRIVAVDIADVAEATESSDSDE
jgi:transcription elongation GreA/GreB family factor